MKKTLVTLALAAVPALIFSACNGGVGGSSGINPSVPSAPGATHHGRVHHMDNGPQDLHAGGATFPAYGYNLGNQPVGTYSGPQTPPGNGSLFYSYGGVGTIYYCLTGSGFGRKEFEANNGTATPACQPLGATPSGFGGRQDPLDFVGSDVAMPSTECCAAGSTYYTGRIITSPSWGQPFEFPTIGGPIVFGFRPQDFPKVTQINLSTWTYCSIANGTVYNWNDPAITADNGGTSVTGGVNETITFYFRSDSSGTTDIFTNKLNTVCGSSWPKPYNAPPYQSPSRTAAWGYGVNSTWPGPNGTGPNGNPFIGESGNPGVLAGVQSTPFSTGYLEGAWAKSANPKVSQAWLQNGYTKKKGASFVNPANRTAVANALASATASSIVYGGGSDGNSLGSTTPWCQLYIPLSVVATPPKKTYPIVGFSYMDFYGNNNGIHLNDKKTLINFMVSSAATTIISKLEYAPLHSSIHTAILNALNGSPSQAACLQ